MIDKTKTGWRIRHLRINHGLSQEELAKELNISVQAVSKWEQGKSLPDIEILLMLSKKFKISINEILEGKDILSSVLNSEISEGEIPNFVDNSSLIDVEWESDMIQQEWVKDNWIYHNENYADFEKVAKRINEHGGVILELGAGPGGGIMPAVLINNLEACIIISDISAIVVNEWKKLLDKERFPNVHYVVVNNCELPFNDNSIDVISTRGGIGNTLGDKELAIKEVYRVLKKEGLFVCSEGFVTKETLSSFPVDIQEILKEKMPSVFENYYEVCVTAGFKTIDTELGNNWSTKDDDSEIATIARELGIEITFTGYMRYCIK